MPAPTGRRQNLEESAIGRRCCWGDHGIAAPAALGRGFGHRGRKPRVRRGPAIVSATLGSSRRPIRLELVVQSLGVDTEPSGGLGFVAPGGSEHPEDMAPLDLGERDLQDVTLRIGFTDQLSQGLTSLDKDNVVIQTLDVAAKLIGRCTGGRYATPVGRGGHQEGGHRIVWREQEQTVSHGDSAPRLVGWDSRVGIRESPR